MVTVFAFYSDNTSLNTAEVHNFDLAFCSVLPTTYYVFPTIYDRCDLCKVVSGAKSLFKHFERGVIFSSTAQFMPTPSSVSRKKLLSDLLIAEVGR